MPIRNCPFTRIYDDDIPRLILPVRIINPHSNKSIKTRGIIDTGADDCAIPAKIAEILGHNLKAGTVNIVGTAKGMATAFSHTTTFEILHPETEKVVYRIENVLIDYMPYLQNVLLGVNNFLDRFILEINYPRQVFSMRRSSRK